MARYLVTGGGGFIGSNLAETLFRRGETVRVLDDFSTGFRRNLDFAAKGRGGEGTGRLEVIEGDISLAEVAARACDGVEIVLHHAALSSVPGSIEDPLRSNQVNVSGSLNLLQAARRAGVRRFVYASSSSIYGEDPELPKRESMAARPMSPYAVSKLAVEHYCRNFYHLFGLETIVLRYFNIFGPRQDPHSPYAAVIPNFIRALLRGQPPTIFGDGRQSRDFTFVEDAVQANLKACEAPESAAGEVFNIARGDQNDLLWLADVLGGILGTDVKPIHAAPRRGDVPHSRADIRKARDGIGYDPRFPLEEGLRRTVEWFR